MAQVCPIVVCWDVGMLLQGVDVLGGVARNGREGFSRVLCMCCSLTAFLPPYVLLLVRLASLDVCPSLMTPDP